MCGYSLGSTSSGAALISASLLALKKLKASWPRGLLSRLAKPPLTASEQQTRNGRGSHSTKHRSRFRVRGVAPYGTLRPGNGGGGASPARCPDFVPASSLPLFFTAAGAVPYASLSAGKRRPGPGRSRYRTHSALAHPLDCEDPRPSGRSDWPPLRSDVRA
ncbi:hypothetical protein NDU88_003351 [Pleurodeles waltl]|uniref:Uncharacterized protein n=1 Tax=Pleurodeles waltl TaxID=8319 RepID=A0AAV7TQU0_PLEWA|nr:hypothetical protein NDU88_003351 [Pleurodeles waltl]